MKQTCKILVVDDNKDVRNTLAGCLADQGHLVTTAGDEKNALKILSSQYFHFIIVDIRLEGDDDADESGVKLTEKIRKQNIDSQIIFITGKAVKGQHLMFAKEYNVLAYIEKTDPNWTDDVCETIDMFSTSETMASTLNRGNIGIFLSYAREDENEVDELYQKLLSAGFKPWIDKKDILGGESWDVSIRNAIRASDFFIACLSNNSVKKRGYLQKELSIALDLKDEKLKNDIYLIPVRLEVCTVPDELGLIQWVDLFEESGWVRLLKAIHKGVEHLENLQ